MRFGRGRLDCRAWHHDAHEARAAVRGGGLLRADEQVAAASAREVPRTHGQGDPLPSALCRPRHEPRGAHHLRAPLQDRLGYPPLHGGPGLLRGGDAVSACHHRRGEREALHHALQRARPRLLPAHRHGAAAEASTRGRFREGVRDRPSVPQRGHGSVPQPRIHHHGGLRGLRRPRLHDESHRGLHQGRGRGGLRHP